MDFKKYEVWSEIFFISTDFDVKNELSLSAKITKYLDWQSDKKFSSWTVLHGGTNCKEVSLIQLKFVGSKLVHFKHGDAKNLRVIYPLYITK
jgi:hypothetical protein